MYIPLKKVFLYGVGGVVGALTDLLFLYIFTEYVGIHYLVSQIFSFIISVFVGFFFQKHITFQKKDGKLKKQGILFLMFQLIGICLNIGIMRYLVEFMGLYYLIASVFAKGVVFFWNFFMNYKFNFK